MIAVSAHGCVSIVRAEAAVEGMKKSGEMRRKHLSDCLGIINTSGTYVPAPAGIHKDQPLGVLNQIGTDRECDPISVRSGQLLDRVF